MPYAIMISYIVSVNSRPFLYRVHWQWQLTADSYTAQPQLARTCDMAQATMLNNELFILYVVVTYLFTYILICTYTLKVYLYSNQQK